MNKLKGSNVHIGKGRYMPGLDGLRALSVFAVIAYHLNLSWAPGGLLGVGIFFTLSGYLITDQLIVQWQSNRRIDLLGFWVRRIRRLMPAMFFMLAIVGAWLIWFDRPRLAELQGDFLSVLLYINNWWLIFHEVSYFESFGPPSPIGHLWSLAIEEQFYFVWPLILAVVLQVVSRRGKLFLLILLGAVASALAMAMIYVPGTDPSRVYYGTDTRAFALLIGAALAVAWPSRKLSQDISIKSRLVLDCIGGAGLLGIMLMIWKTNQYNEFLYYGGLALFSILTAVVTAVLAHPASTIAKVMGSKPLRWVGLRSYSLYLWHFPVIILTTPTVNTNDFNGSRALLQLALSLLLATISWKYVEEPIRRGSWVIFWNKLRSWFPLKRRYGFTLAFFSLILLLISCYGIWNADKLSATEQSNIGGETQEVVDVGPSPTSVPEKQSDSDQPPVDKKPTAQPDDGSKTDNGSKVDEPKTDGSKPEDGSKVDEPKTDGSKPEDGSKVDEPKTDGSKPEDGSKVDEPKTDGSKPEDGSKVDGSKPDTGKGITAIGDSVILDAAPHLAKLLPGIVIDGKVGRQMSQAQEVIDELKAEGKLGERIIIELGTNGAFSKKQLRQLLTSLEDAQQIVLVNTRVPRKWQDTVNSTLEEVAAEFPKVMVVDWYSASANMDSLFADDGVHLKSEGAKYFASIVSEAIQQENV